MRAGNPDQSNKEWNWRVTKLDHLLSYGIVEAQKQARQPKLTGKRQ